MSRPLTVLLSFTLVCFAFAAADAWGQGGVPGSPQVMLKVRIAELNRSALREVGINLFDGTSGLNLLRSSGTNFELTFPVADGVLTGSILDALSSTNQSRILAEPSLVTAAGQPATFFSGGGTLITPIAGVGVMNFNGMGAQLLTPDNRLATLDGATIVYGKGGVMFQPFGTNLSWVPSVIDDDRIRMNVVAEVSGFLGGANAEINPLNQPSNVAPIIQVPELRNSSVAGGLDANLSAGFTLPSGITLQATAGYMLLASKIGTGVSGNVDVWTLGLIISIPLYNPRPPTFTGLPYIDRLFRNTGAGRDSSELMLQVTPRIIIQEEEEE